MDNILQIGDTWIMHCSLEVHEMKSPHTHTSPHSPLLSARTLSRAAHTLTLAGSRIVNGIPLLQLTAVYAEENELAHEGISPKLEGQRAELLVVVRRNINNNIGSFKSNLRF